MIYLKHTKNPKSIIDKTRPSTFDNLTIFDRPTRSFPTVIVNFAEFSSRDLHTDYVDFVRWFGDLVFSKVSQSCLQTTTLTHKFLSLKSIQNCICLWKPGLIEDDIESITRTNDNVTYLHDFDIENCSYWYIRFDIDFSKKVLAVVWIQV